MLLIGEALEDWFTGQEVFKWIVEHLVDEFNLMAPFDADELGRRHMWGPNLVFPSLRTAISPWIMAGDPCLKNSRIPTGSLYVLHRDRGLDAQAIADLYPGTEPESVSDAISLETRLRRLPKAA